MRAYIALFPKSRLRLAMRISLYVGIVLLIAGLLLEFRLMRSQRTAGEPLDFVTRQGFGFGNPGGIACPTTLRSAASFAG